MTLAVHPVVRRGAGEADEAVARAEKKRGNVSARKMLAWAQKKEGFAAWPVRS